MKDKELRLFRNWWLLLLKGCLILLFGIVFISAFWVALFDSVPNYKVLIYAFIIITLVNGILILSGTFLYGKKNTHRGYWLFEGSFDFVIGLSGIIGIMIIGALKPHILNLFFIQIISFWGLVHGITHFFSSLRLKPNIPSRKYAVFTSLSLIVLSLILFIKPVFSSKHDNLFVGSFLILIGVLLSFISFNLRRIYAEEDK